MATPKPRKKNAAAVSLGRRGGLARFKGLSARRRSEIARAASNARWHPRRKAASHAR